VARRLAKLVVHWSARGREDALAAAVTAAGGQMFPEQAAFSLRRQHSFVQQLVELAEALRMAPLGNRCGANR
jgi:hypothetical protein